MTGPVARQLARVAAEVAEAARAAGRDPASVRLLAVSKTFPAAAVRAAYDAGCRAFGESKAQELELKRRLLPPDIEWHFIGHLQRNKAAQVLRDAAWIHSVDSLKLLERLERLAGDMGKRPVILLEVNLGGEADKTGAPWEALPELAAAAKACRHLRWAGLMGMAPLGGDGEAARACFGRLRRRRDELAAGLEIDLPELSMGMSGDYAAAIAEGATIVRIGSAIFGIRDYGD